MDNKDELIAKLKREKAYLKSLLEQNGRLLVANMIADKE